MYAFSEESLEYSAFYFSGAQMSYIISNMIVFLVYFYAHSAMLIIGILCIVHDRDTIYDTVRYTAIKPRLKDQSRYNNGTVYMYLPEGNEPKIDLKLGTFGM